MKIYIQTSRNIVESTAKEGVYKIQRRIYGANGVHLSKPFFAKIPEQKIDGCDSEKFGKQQAKKTMLDQYINGSRIEILKDFEQ